MIRFMIAGDLDYSETDTKTFMQLKEDDTYDLLAWLQFEPTDFGYLEAPEVAARCRRRLWPIPRNFDPAIPERSELTANGNVKVVVCAREAGYLRARTQELLQLAERAGPEGQILFS